MGNGKPNRYVTGKLFRNPTGWAGSDEGPCRSSQGQICRPSFDLGRCVRSSSRKNPCWSQDAAQAFSAGLLSFRSWPQGRQ